jgi:predicted TIM-barrel fold metal-dependent hydrolase
MVVSNQTGSSETVASAARDRCGPGRHGRVDVVVIDAHLHLWDTGRQHYSWLQRPENSAINRIFGFEDFRSRAAATPVERAVRPSVGEGLALLEQRHIPFDVISVLPRHLSHVPALSQRYPALRMVLDHLAHPPLGDAQSAAARQWQALITTAASNPLVFAKISGLYPPGPFGSWTADDIRAVVEFVLELFGPDRLMFGSDWPVAELGGGYVKVWSELSTIFDQLPAPDRAAVLGGTAARCYGLKRAVA